MAGGKSTVLANKILNFMTRAEGYNPPNNLYLALFNVAPTAAGGGTEVSAIGYARKLITFSTAANGQTSNSNLVNFGTAPEDWGTVRAFAIFDAPTGGEMQFFVTVPSRRLDANALVTVQIGDVRLSEI